ncbi:MAG: type II secretion system protein [Gemmatimonadaceae bacterium]|nr:type II secretion system protein [Gemmatimonadaceae bacterium]
MNANRRGFALPELVVTIMLVALVALLAIPPIQMLKERTALQAARRQLMAGFDAARAAAMQKGKVSTVSLRSSRLNVTALSGLTGNTVRILGPLDFSISFGATVTPIGGSPDSIVYDARGLSTPIGTGTRRYRLAVGGRADTICVSAAGLVLNRQCVL